MAFKFAHNTSTKKKRGAPEVYVSSRYDSTQSTPVDTASTKTQASLDLRELTLELRQIKSMLQSVLEAQGLAEEPKPIFGGYTLTNGQVVDPNVWYTVQETADILTCDGGNCYPQLVNNWTNRYDWPVIKDEGKKRIPGVIVVELLKGTHPAEVGN